jgi:hypothetical protein
MALRQLEGNLKQTHASPALAVSTKGIPGNWRAPCVLLENAALLFRQG